MTDMQLRDQVVNDDGSNRSGVTSTTRTTADPNTGASTQLRTVHAWSGRTPGVEIVWLVAGVVLAFLALDFIFHATGANKVGAEHDEKVGRRTSFGLGWLGRR